MRKRGWVASITLLAATSAYPAPTPYTTPGRIQNSKHDMNTVFSWNGEKGEICIYCHTPHNAVVAQPLWNRHNPTPSEFILYNSPTLTHAARSSVLTPSSISLFCMSCHDGVTGLGDVQNKNIVGGNGYGVVASMGAVGTATIGVTYNENALLGRNLTTTHPVGFDFNPLSAADTGIRSKTEILAIFESKRRQAGTSNAPAAIASRDFLYGPDNNMFECASCHRVHDPGTSGNFLRIENDRSQLCLACHAK